MPFAHGQFLPRHADVTRVFPRSILHLTILTTHICPLPPISITTRCPNRVRAMPTTTTYQPRIVSRRLTSPPILASSLVHRDAQPRRRKRPSPWPSPISAGLSRLARRMSTRLAPTPAGAPAAAKAENLAWAAAARAKRAVSGRAVCLGTNRHEHRSCPTQHARDMVRSVALTAVGSPRPTSWPFPVLQSSRCRRTLPCWPREP